MAFVVVFLQELAQGRPLLEGINEGDPINVALLAAAGATTVGLTGWLALKGDDDYTKKDLEL